VAKSAQASYADGELTIRLAHEPLSLTDVRERPLRHILVAVSSVLRRHKARSSAVQEVEWMRTWCAWSPHPTEPYGGMASHLVIIYPCDATPEFCVEGFRDRRTPTFLSETRSATY